MFPSRWIDQIVHHSGANRNTIRTSRFRPKVEQLEERANPSNVLANRFTTFGQSTPAVAHFEDGGSVVVWQSSMQDGSGLGVFGRLIDAGGNPLQSEFQANSRSINAQGRPAVAADGVGGFIVVWEGVSNTGDVDVFAQRFDALGARRGDEFQVNQTTAGDQFDPSVAMDRDGDFVVTWVSQDQDGDGLGIYARKIDPENDTRGTPVRDSGEFRVNTITTGAQTSPDVAVDRAGNLIIAWASFNSGLTSFDIKAQRFDLNGVALGSETLVNSFQNEAQINPAIAADATGNFVVVWQSLFQDGSGFGIYGQRFTSDGQAQGSEFRINSTTTGAQTSPDVASTDRGDFIVVWNSLGQDGSSEGVFAQTYSREGAVLQSEFIANEVTAGAQKHPAVAIDSSGRYSILWDSPGVDGSAEGVVFESRALQANLAPVGSPVPAITLVEDAAAPAVRRLFDFFEDDFTLDQDFRFDIVNTQNPELFSASFDRDGQLLISAVPNANGSGSVTVRVIDRTGAFTDQLIPITVQPVNDAPTELLLSGSSINENVPANSTVGLLSAVDVDSPETFTFTLVAGPGSENNGDFRIVGDQLQFAGVPNFEVGSTSRNVRVRVTDSGGTSFEANFIIDILNVDEAPTSLTLSNSTIVENVPPGTPVGDLIATDEDFGESLTFELFDDGTPNDNDRFDLVSGSPNGTPGATQLVTRAGVDFEESPTRRVVIRVTDSTGLSRVESFVISITNVNEGPAQFVINQTQTLFENAGPNFVFAELAAVDPEGGPVTFESMPGVFDNDLFTITGNQLALRNSVDFEMRSTLVVRLRAVDAQNTVTTNIFELRVENRNEAPTNLALNNLTVPENQAFFTVGSLSVLDPDANDPITYELIGGPGSADNDQFFINDNQLITNQELDFEANPTRTVRIRATDREGLATEQTFTLTLLDNNDRPKFDPGRDLIVSPGASLTLPNFITNIVAGGPEESEQQVTFIVDQVNAPFLFSRQPTISPDGTLDFEVINPGPNSGFFSTTIFYRLVDDGGTANGGQDSSFQSSFNITIDPTQIVPRTGAIPATPFTSFNQINTAVARDAQGNYIVVWQQDNGNTIPPNTQFAPGDGEAQDILAQLFDREGVALSSTFVVNLTTVDDQVTPTVAMDDAGNFVVVWVDEFFEYYGYTYGYASSSYVRQHSRIVAQRFDALGQRIGSEILIDEEDRIGDLTRPDVGLDANGNLLVTWTERFEMFVPGPTSGGSFITRSEIRASRLDVNSNLFFDDVLVSGTTVNAEQSALAIDADGDAVIVWDAEEEGLDVFFRRTDAGGNFVSTPTQVNAQSSGDQIDADVGVDQNGNFIVVWNDRVGPSTIQARRFDAGGNPLTSDLPIATGSGNLREPSISVRRDGTHAIAWTDDTGDLNGATAAVDFQVFRPDGTPFGTVNRASSDNAVPDRDPSIILGNNRDQIVVAFESNVNQSTGRFNALQSRFAFSAAPVGVDLSSNQVSENAPPGTIVGSLLGRDLDDFPIPIERFNFSVSIPPGAPFSVGGEFGELIILNGPLDFESQSSYVLTVRVTDATGLTGTFDVFINVLDGNDAPLDIILRDGDNGSEIVEVEVGSINGSLVGFLYTYDPNFDFPFTYELINNAGGLFGVSGDVLFIADDSLITPGIVTIRVRSTDPFGLSREEDFSINIRDDEDTAPPVITINGTTGLVADQTAPRFFNWNITDDSGLSFVEVIIRQDGDVIFTSSAASDTFDFTGRDLGNFSIEITAIDNDTDRPNDQLSATNSASATVIDDDTAPPITTIDTSGVGAFDNQTQSFSWTVNDFSSGASTARVQLFQDGQLLIDEFRSASDSLNFDRFGAGTFEIIVTGFDDDHDRPDGVDILSSTASAIVVVADNDLVGPTVDVSGSIGDETDAQLQQFNWNVTDFSGGVSRTQVIVTQDGREIFRDENAPANSFFNFDDLGLGTFEISVTGYDIDADTETPFGALDSPDANFTTVTRSVTVRDDDVIGPDVTITGSSGVVTDGDGPSFTWSVIDPSIPPPRETPSFQTSAVLRTEVRVFEGGSTVPIFENLNAAPSDTFNFAREGLLRLGTFRIEVTGFDDDNDFVGDSAFTTASRTVTITDDDIVGPEIILGGSGENVVGENPALVETDGQNQRFTWNVNDLGSGVRFTSVFVEQNGQLIFSSGSREGAFDFNGLGVGDFLITVIASDADGDTLDDASSSRLQRRVVVIDDDNGPDVTLGGSEGVEADEQTQEFTWNFDTQSPLGSVVSVGIFKDGNLIASSAELSGRFNFDALGLGIYTIVLSGTDGDNDRPGDSVTVVDSRRVVVFDDVPTMPVITLDGSIGREDETLTQRFVWSSTEVSLGAVLNSEVVVIHNNVVIFTSDLPSGEFAFDIHGEGAFEFSIRTKNSDTDFAGDEGQTVGLRSAFVFDVDGPIEPIEEEPEVPPVEEPPVVNPPTPPPVPVPVPVRRVIVTVQPTPGGLLGILPTDSGETMGNGSNETDFVGDDQIREDAVVSLRELGNVAILLSDIDVPTASRGELGTPPPVTDELAAISADPDELKKPEPRPIALPSVAVSSILDGDDSVGLIEQLDRMSRPISVTTPPSVPNRGPMQPPAAPDAPAPEETRLPDANELTQTTPDVNPISEEELRTHSEATASLSGLIDAAEEPRRVGPLGWLIAATATLQGASLGWRRWLRRRLGQR